LTPFELRDCAVLEWERHQEKLRRGTVRITPTPVVGMRASQPQPVGVTRAYPPEPDAAVNEQLSINRPADLSITALAAAITKVLNGAVAPVVIQAATGIGTDSDGIGGIDDG